MLAELVKKAIACNAIWEVDMGNGKITRHHIIPRSKGGSDNGDNIAMVGQILHDKYHSLFDNRTPEEILDFLVNYFWDGKVNFIENYINRRWLEWQGK